MHYIDEEYERIVEKARQKIWEVTDKKDKWFREKVHVIDEFPRLFGACRVKNMKTKEERTDMNLIQLEISLEDEQEEMDRRAVILLFTVASLMAVSIIFFSLSI